MKYKITIIWRLCQAASLRSEHYMYSMSFKLNEVPQYSRLLRASSCILNLLVALEPVLCMEDKDRLKVVRLSMWLYNWSEWRDHKPGEKILVGFVELCVITLFRKQKQKKKQTKTPKQTLSWRIHDCCLMLFQDCLCLTQTEFFFLKEPLMTAFKRKSSGRLLPWARKRSHISAGEGRTSSCMLIPEITAWKCCSTSIHLFFINLCVPRSTDHLSYVWLVQQILMGDSLFLF